MKNKLFKKKLSERSSTNDIINLYPDGNYIIQFLKFEELVKQQIQKLMGIPK